ncbi:Tat pathway signal sequence domain protein, partial [Streptomyces tendae]
QDGNTYDQKLGAVLASSEVPDVVVVPGWGPLPRSGPGGGVGGCGGWFCGGPKPPPCGGWLGGGGGGWVMT